MRSDEQAITVEQLAELWQPGVQMELVCEGGYPIRPVLREVERSLGGSFHLRHRDGTLSEVRIEKGDEIGLRGFPCYMRAAAEISIYKPNGCPEFRFQLLAAGTREWRKPKEEASGQMSLDVTD